MKALSELCKPRSSVFDRIRLDTVYNLDDLPLIKPDEFFAENYVTEGMRILLTEAFNRVEGRTTSASGTFLLSQSMGGGKTHNLIALGFLAKYPNYRKKLWLSSTSRGIWVQYQLLASAVERQLRLLVSGERSPSN